MASESAASVPFTVLMYHVNRRFLESETRSKGTRGLLNNADRSAGFQQIGGGKLSSLEGYLPASVQDPPVLRQLLFLPED